MFDETVTKVTGTIINTETRIYNQHVAFHG
jgi:hypothetical protein